MPLNGYDVIPPRWQEHHRPVADRTMTLPARLWRPPVGPPPFGGGPAPEELVWEGRCRLQQHNTRTTDSVVADQPVQVREYLIVTPVEVLPIARGGEGGDVIEAGGRRYEVLQVLPGSLIWECDLICQDAATQNGAGVIP